MEEILLIVSASTGFSVLEIIGKRQTENLVAARAYISIKAAEREIKDNEIAFWLNRDRSTILHYRYYYKPTFYFNLIKQWSDQTINALSVSTREQQEA